MVKFSVIFLSLTFLFFCFEAESQFSKENSGEFIFSFSDIEKSGVDIPSKMRFTLFFHLGQNYHYDVTDNLGFFSGYGIRNVGIVSEENDIVYKRRTYALGVPIALKIGSFKDHMYFYTGGEYELFFHYKQKQYIDGDKSKQSEWFSDRTQRFAPSFFAGFQFPGGINLKFKYYPNNFLNTDFRGRDFGIPVDYSDFSKTRLFYLALSFNFKSKDLKKIYNPDDQPGRIANL